MSLKDDCKQLVESALGKALTARQAQDIEDRMNYQMRALARENPEDWRALPYAERLQRAAREAASTMRDDYVLAQKRVQLQMDAHDRIENAFAHNKTQQPSGVAKFFRFLRNDDLAQTSRLLDFDTRRGEYFSVQSYKRAIAGEAFGRLQATWDAMPGRFWGLFENKEGIQALWKELHHEDSGNAIAKAGAKAFHEQADEMRSRYNAAGGNVGRLEEWGIPQDNSQSRVASAGVTKYAADTLPLLDRDHYLNADGSRMTDDQLRKFLGYAYDSISTNGQNSREPGNVAGYGMLANRNDAHRALFFKDADAHGKYISLYGQRTLSGLLTNHINRMARDIALVERLGPNAERTFNYFNDRARLSELRKAPERSAQIEADHLFNRSLFDEVAGRSNPVNSNLAGAGQAFRNWMIATKLGKVVFTALGDEAGMASTAWANKVPYSDAFFRELKTLNPADATDRRIAQHAGFGFDVHGVHMQRLGTEEFGQSGWTSRLASTVMQVTGAERMWEARREGMSAVLSSALGHLTREVEHFSDLNPQDHGVLANKGVDERVWQVWRRAEPEDWGARAQSVLTANSVWRIPDERLADLGDPRTLKREASTQLLAHVIEEAGMGAMDTGPRQRVSMAFGTQAGTKGGELVRAMNLFRGFSMSMMMKHWARAAQAPGVGAIKYMAPLIVYGTALGAIRNQIGNLLMGQNPEDMTTPQFWGKAALRGGGLGFFGEFLQNEVSSFDTSLTAAIGGPGLTTLEDLLKISHEAYFKYERGERVDEGAKIIRFVRGNVPNFWYTQAAADHLIWNNMMEAASPGYLERMEARQQKLYGRTYWWHPYEALPSEAPNPELATRAP